MKFLCFGELIKFVVSMFLLCGLLHDLGKKEKIHFQNHVNREPPSL